MVRGACVARAWRVRGAREGLPAVAVCVCVFAVVHLYQGQGLDTVHAALIPYSSPSRHLAISPSRHLATSSLSASSAPSPLPSASHPNPNVRALARAFTHRTSLFVPLSLTTRPSALVLL